MNSDTIKKISAHEILLALETVMDPEIPVLSVVDLGIITGISVNEDEKVTVKMTPTFTGCPAIHLMQKEISDCVKRLGFSDVEVLIDRSVSWSTNLISDRGREALKNFKLALPVKHHGEITLEMLAQSACPHCGSSDTSLQNPFGPTLCRSIHFCFSCKQAFEQFKPV